MYDTMRQQISPPRYRLALILFFKLHDKLTDEQAERRVHELERWLANGWAIELEGRD